MDQQASEGQIMIPRKKTKKMLMMASVSAVAMSANSAMTFAQGIALDEIVVTAQKRNESVQTVPIAMSAFDATFMERVNLDNVKDLIKFSPGFAGNSKDSFVDFVNVRGISTNDFGNGGDPSVGFFRNGLYQGRTGSAVSSLYDIERAEVLRGPQGFLFGRNAISGAISFHTKKPDFDNFSGYAEVGMGERNILEAEAAVNMPVSDAIAFRLAGYTSHENGWIENTFMPDSKKLAGHDKTAVRFTAAFKGDSWDATIIAEHEDKETSGTVYRAIEGVESAGLEDAFGNDIMPSNNKRTTHSSMGLGNYDNADILAISAEINIDFSFATFMSLTGFKDHEYQYAEDYDGMSLAFYDYAQDQEGDYFEQELRFVSNGDGPLSWYAGASYFKENIKTLFTNHGDEDVACGAYYYADYGYNTCLDLYTYWGYAFTKNPDGLTEANWIDGEYHGWATYVDMNYAISEKFDLGVGVRYTKNVKDFAVNILPVDSDLGPWLNYGFTTDGFVSQEKKWDDFTPRFIARYRPTDDMMVYASVTKGFKSGGFNSLGAVPPAGLGPEGDGLDEDLVGLPGTLPDSFDPETVWSYEVGIKGDLMENRLRYDFNAYYYRYKDLQLNFWDSGVKVDNIGKVKAHGFEGTVQAVLSEHFDILLAGAYNSNEIKGADLIAEGSDGNRLSGSPKFRGSGMLSFHAPITQTGEINASLDFAAQTSSFVGIGNIEDGRLSSWADLSFRLGYKDDAGWAITAYVENLANQTYFDGGYEGGDRLPTVVFGASRPTTFGAKFSMSFGE